MTDLIGTSEIAWIVFLILGLSIEIPAIFDDKRGNTLSSVLRYVFGFSSRQKDTGKSRMVRQGAWWALIILFAGHIGFGW